MKIHSPTLFNFQEEKPQTHSDKCGLWVLDQAQNLAAEGYWI